jgi:hypothetical protein
VEDEAGGLDLGAGRRQLGQGADVGLAPEQEAKRILQAPVDGLIEERVGELHPVGEAPADDRALAVPAQGDRGPSRQ